MTARSPSRTLLRDARAETPLWQLYPVFFAAVYLSHLTLLRLPYFWDEGGYYIPAAWDFFRTGTLIPVTTATNAHPPLPSILLAGWWRLSGFVPSGTRTFICMVTAAALLAVFRLARNLLGTRAAVATTLLTALYPIWFAQSTLAHADIFAAAFTLWGLSFYLEPVYPAVAGEQHVNSVKWISQQHQIYAAILFSLAALSKETAIVTPVALAAGRRFCWCVTAAFRACAARTPDGSALCLLPSCRSRPGTRTTSIAPALSSATRSTCVTTRRRTWTRSALRSPLPQGAAPDDAHEPVCASAVRSGRISAASAIRTRTRLPRPALNAIAVILIANWIAFSVLGGALLTRYLLPMYPLILLVAWRSGSVACAPGDGLPRSAARPFWPACGSTLPTPSRRRTTSPTAT